MSIRKLFCTIVTRFFIRGKYYILSTLAIVATFLYMIKDFNLYANYIALGFSVIGPVIILVLQIKDSKQFADYKPNTFSEWLRALTRNNDNVIGAAIIEAAHARVEANAEIILDLDATINRKIDYLMNEVRNLQNNNLELKRQVDNIDVKMNTNQNEIKNILRSETSKLGTLIAGHAIDLYDLNILGITLTICGVLIQTFCIITI